MRKKLLLLFLTKNNKIAKKLKYRRYHQRVIKNKKDGCNIILENNDKTELKAMGWSNKL